jgi:hypothetical protein
MLPRRASPSAPPRSQSLFKTGSKEAFEKVSARESGYRHEYFLYAYKCGQWEEMLRQLPLLGPINYSYFSGREQFDKMFATAKEKTVQ